MNDMKLKQSISRWEYEGGALLPADSNVHFWRYRGAETPKSIESDYLSENKRYEHAESAARNPRTN
jgi:hypothetical protein